MPQLAESNPLYGHSVVNRLSTRTFGHVLAGLDGEEVVAVIREYPPALSGPGGGATLVGFYPTTADGSVKRGLESSYPV